VFVNNSLGRIFGNTNNECTHDLYRSLRVVGAATDWRVGWGKKECLNDFAGETALITITLTIEKAYNVKVNITKIVWDFDFNCLRLGVWTLYTLRS
jgi:hypothetical protein